MTIPHLPRILATTALCLAAGAGVNCYAQEAVLAPVCIQNHVIVLHSCQVTSAWQVCEDETAVQQVDSEYFSAGECLVFETCNLELHGYQRENYGCAGIGYERLDNRHAILHFREPDSGDMSTQQTLLVFDSPTSGHYYDIVYVTSGNGTRIVTIYPMDRFCIRKRTDERAGAYIGDDTACDCPGQ